MKKKTATAKQENEIMKKVNSKKSDSSVSKFNGMAAFMGYLVSEKSL